MATVLSATQGLLKIANPAGTQTFLAQMATVTPAQRQVQMLTQLKLLAEAQVPGGTRLLILEALRDAVLETQNARGKEYWGKPVPFADDFREIFDRSIALWRLLADCYESLVADMVDAAPDLAEHAEVICYRALRCAGFAMTACNRAYYALPDELWEQLHRLYSFAESADVTDTPVSEGAGQSTVNLAYLQIVLSQRAKPDSLSLLQMNTVDRALAQWVALGALTKEPGTADGNSALAVDLDSAQGARRLKHFQGKNLRYLELEKIGDKLRQTAIALKKQSPDKLGFGSIPGDVCEKLMLTLYAHWLTPGTARLDERKPMAFNVLVSGTLAAMHFNISGKPFAPPDAGLSSRAKFDMAGFQRVDGPTVGEASARSRTLETWAVVNQSASGMLGMCHKPSDTTRLTHGQLLGLVAPNGNTYVGFAQRLGIDAAGVIMLGFRLLRAKAQAVAARVSNIEASYDRAILLTAGPGDEPPTILLTPGTYAPSRVLDIHDGRPHTIRLTALLDSGANFERAAYTAI
jgi:cyclic-di-GMP-binding protein